MGLFDVFPLTEPMNLSLHLAMIGGYGDKGGEEKCERQIAALIPVELIEGDGTDEADQEDREPPSGEESAGSCAVCDQAVCALDDGLNLSSP